jgi:hypothetical protein
LITCVFGAVVVVIAIPVSKADPLLAHVRYWVAIITLSAVFVVFAPPLFPVFNADSEATSAGIAGWVVSAVACHCGAKLSQHTVFTGFAKICACFEDALRVLADVTRRAICVVLACVVFL